MGRQERDRELARRRTRRAKLKRLRQQFAEAKTDSDKQAIREKVRKVSPFVDLDADQAAQSE